MKKRTRTAGAQVLLQTGFRIQSDMTGRKFKDRNPRRKATTKSSNNHKSQGSEFPVVVIPLAMQHYMLP